VKLTPEQIARLVEARTNQQATRARIRAMAEESRMMTKHCACGWQRPLISVTTLAGKAPPADVVPVYHCPQCGRGYVPDEVSEAVALRILRDLGTGAAKPS
jgi:hypothetical protein